MTSTSLPLRESAVPRFDAEVPESGYRWWYVDGLSADGQNGVVVIGFIGSVFSPYYYAARRRGPADPEQHCALNVGLYRPEGKRWAMTERGAGCLDRGPGWLSVGPSSMRWVNDHLEIRVRERSAPLGLPLAGTILVRPRRLSEHAFALDQAGRHLWQPIAPCAEIELRFSQPRLAWSGSGYFDTNAGARALENDFASWNWSRCHVGANTEITYAVTARDGREHALALEYPADGPPRQVPCPPARELPSTGWRIRRTAHSEGYPAVLRSLEDTPFYARTMLVETSTVPNRLVMHESLSLERFRTPWVRAMLPFRMPRFSRR
jgi:carotenoid 1,2-hydratase